MHNRCRRRPGRGPTCPTNAGASSTPERSPAARRLAEADFDRLAVGGVLDLEELPRRESAVVGDDRVREDLDLGVERLDVRVVDPARGLDLVLDLGQLVLELLEVL